MADDAEARVRREDALDSAIGLPRAVADEESACVRRISDPDAAAVVYRDEVRPGGRVEERIQDWPVGDRIGSVAHSFRLAIRRGDRARVEVVSRDADRPAQDSVSNHSIDDRPKPCPLSIPE